MKLPEDRLSLRDFVRARVFEEVRTSKDSIKELTEQLKVSRETERKAESDASRAQRRIESIERETQAAQGSQASDITVLTARNEALQQELTNVRLKYEESKEAGMNGEDASYRMNQISAKYDEVCRELMLAKAAVRAMEEEKKNNQADYMERAKAVELLQVDKAYLSKEVERLDSKVSELELSLAKKKSKMTELKKARDELIEKMQRMDGQRRESTEDQVAKELAFIKERAETEREAIRSNLRELYEREGISLRDARDLAIVESERANQKLNESKLVQDQLMQTHRDMESKLSNQVVEARSQLKMRMFELDRANLAYEDSMDTVRQLKLENEAFRKKVELLKEEYYRVDGNCTKQLSHLEARCAEQQRRLDHYDKLEKELDCAIAEAPEGSSGEAVVTLGSGLPSDAARRIRQSISLARQVSVSQKELASVKGALAARTRELEQARSEAASAKQRILEVKKGPDYLIQLLEKKDADLQRAEMKAQEATEALSGVDAERNEARRGLDVARQDLKILLGQQNELGMLKKALDRQNGVRAPGKPLADVTKQLQNARQEAENFVIQEVGTENTAPNIVGSGWASKLAKRRVNV